MTVTPLNQFNLFEYQLRAHVFYLDQLSNAFHHKGFDYWVETLSMEQKLEVLKGSESLDDSLKAFVDWNWFNVSDRYLKTGTKQKWFRRLKKKCLTEYLNLRYQEKGGV